LPEIGPPSGIPDESDGNRDRRQFRARVALIEPDRERTLTFEGQEARTILALIEAGPADTKDKVATLYQGT
jgi:hypothetical protein